MGYRLPTNINKLPCRTEKGKFDTGAKFADKLECKTNYRQDFSKIKKKWLMLWKTDLMAYALLYYYSLLKTKASYNSEYIITKIAVLSHS